MNICKNCGKEIDSENKKRKYCSLTCRNIYVNKHIRNYTKNGASVKNYYLKKYNKNPKKCAECDSVLSYEKRNNKFCGKSCAAKFNNKIRIVKNRKFSQIGINNIRNAIEKKFNFSYDEYYVNPKKCIECDSILSYNKRNNKFCNKICRKKYDRKHMNKYQIYYRECQFNFNLNDYSNEFDFNLIKKHGWYRAKNNGDNLSGISRDHMFSIKEGFENGIDAKIIAHPANCKLMVHNENKRKHTKSSITIEELNRRINEWNNKYKHP